MPWHKPRIRAANGQTIILLHGLWRSVWAMEPMARYLNQRGYHTINIPYPSFRKSIEENAQIIHEIIKTHEKSGNPHFVTHSLGGIITRKLLAEWPPENTGRIVMLAPPNQGCEILDWLNHHPLATHILGPSGIQLGCSAIQANAPLIAKEVDTAIIMGTQSTIPFFRSLLDQENDGIVSADSGRIADMNEFQVIDADHTFIAANPQAMKMTGDFIQYGSINEPHD